MKQIIIFLILVFSGSFCFSQTIFDLEKIKKETLDTTASSTFTYNSLVEVFNNNPSLLDISKGTIIYYGKLFREGYKPYKFDFKEIELSKLISKKKYKRAIVVGEEIIRRDPSNLKILKELFVCYKKVGFNDKANITEIKLGLLVSSILAQGSGQLKENTLKIISVGDEYTMMRVLGISGISRNSVMTGQSTFDTWKAKDPKGKRIDFFVELLINLQALPNFEK